MGEREPFRMEEQPELFSYSSPRLHAEAAVELPRLRRGEAYSVGWVQAVTEKKSYLTYLNGSISWVLQDLDQGRCEAVNDSDGSECPWYSIGPEEKNTIKGPARAQTVEVEMEDELTADCPWCFPMGMQWLRFLRKVQRERWLFYLHFFRQVTLARVPFMRQESLVGVHRHQSLKTWLVMKNEVTGSFSALKGFGWNVHIDISVDSTRQLGQRATLSAPLGQEQPTVLTHLDIPSSALRFPPANEAQKHLVHTGNKTYCVN